MPVHTDLGRDIGHLTAPALYPGIYDTENLTASYHRPCIARSSIEGTDLLTVTDFVDVLTPDTVDHPDEIARARMMELVAYEDDPIIPVLDIRDNSGDGLPDVPGKTYDNDSDRVTDHLSHHPEDFVTYRLIRNDADTPGVHNQAINDLIVQYSARMDGEMADQSTFRYLSPGVFSPQLDTRPQVIDRMIGVVNYAGQRHEWITTVTRVHQADLNIHNVTDKQLALMYHAFGFLIGADGPVDHFDETASHLTSTVIGVENNWEAHVAVAVSVRTSDLLLCLRQFRDRL